MRDITASGSFITLTSTVTFPNGIVLSALADDQDPLDFDELTISQTGMGLNGDLVVWSKPVPVPVKIAVIATSEDDINLNTLFKAVKPAKGRRGSREKIDIEVNYADGTTKKMVGGIITSGIDGNALSSEGRFKTKVYGFTFEAA